MTAIKSPGRQLLLQGNEAIVEGALAAGCRFFAGYPITPATEISEAMSYRLPAVGGTFIQMEDEIASLGAVIGASLAGAKAMTATSGPGFSLMQENLGFACAAEVPCVIVNVMRGGPSTGLPTNVSQGDLMQARWGTHGDHPIIVLAVSTTQDCFGITLKAFNLSEKYRTPVIILADEVVAHTREKIHLPHPEQLEVVDRIRPNMPPDWYIPYEDNSRGVPPMSAFGDGYRYHVTGLVHDVRGFPTQRPDEIVAFMNRLFRKINQHFMDIQLVEEELTADAEVAVIAYGSVSRSARRAVREARERGVKAGLIQVVTIWPFPRQALEPVLRRVKAVLVPEMNMGQLSREVKRINQGMTRVETLNRIDGNLITPQEILTRLMKL
ncbi:2-oxoacid:acceptor oxidoreductase subunit alpha [Syntrophobacter fumaroxidans]|uniref:2-oxoglutarate ferredoxin oxidoreductase, alpha subunit n=1 Tax=Syntrophobacter fumaroxidans (strain DSM 10017 / MPOB) TaxID=335543 RepID=A0LHF7_SYNFM|nr:2-oxoacid:acceptor oxidoreductase subunit alpha [Syntrophobacter fumaroxidans]ABK16859.1 2-oxoglutarate ferredoxin oxidoreductase, alpha subunit [Syntrophobacter fumaroxidans MPOB]HOI96592.1 2-oxoacid:acceptor oxidoreductase subunit alpha [Syntrophobacter fumaroxidans]